MATMTKVASVLEIPAGTGKVVTVKGKQLAVFNCDGKFYALDELCTHRGGPLSEGVIGNGQVICPLHGHKFDLATGQGSERLECIKVMEVWEQNGKIFLQWCPQVKTCEMPATVSEEH